MLSISGFVRRHGTGQVYVFQANAGSSYTATHSYTYQVQDSTYAGDWYWVQQTVLQASDAHAGGRFGESVDVHKTQIVVGSPGGIAQARYMTTLTV